MPLIVVRSADGTCCTWESNDGVSVFSAALDYADKHGLPVLLSPGVYLTDTVNYRGQSIAGSGIDKTVVRGLPGKDVFLADSSLSAFARENAAIRDLTVMVDDSVDATGLFNRGGVGNAGFAFEFPDGSKPQPLRWNRADLDRVLFRSVSYTSHGKNGSCGLYLQQNANLSRFRNVSFYRLNYGYWDDTPSTNLTSVEFAGDHNHWDSPYFNGCGSAWRLINCNASQITALTMHSNGDGLAVIGRQSASRSSSYRLTISQAHIEDTSGVPWNCTFERSDVRGLYIAGPHDAVTLASKSSSYDTVTVSANTTPYLIVGGQANRVRGFASAKNLSDTNPALVSDVGFGNTVDFTY